MYHPEVPETMLVTPGRALSSTESPQTLLPFTALSIRIKAERTSPLAALNPDHLTPLQFWLQEKREQFSGSEPGGSRNLL